MVTFLQYFQLQVSYRHEIRPVCSLYGLDAEISSFQQQVITLAKLDNSAQQGLVKILSLTSIIPSSEEFTVACREATDSLVHSVS